MALFFYKEKNKDIRAAAYLRLSIEDGDKAESNSIGNQRELIRDFVAERPELHLVGEYADDGYTGTNFERPGFTQMMEDIKSSKINCIIVKDLSRLGRNYIEMGKYLEQIFPMMGIRFIAINDNYDNANTESSDSDSIVVPFKNLLNDSYCRDISIKVRSQLDIKRRKGEFIGGYAMYGYCKDERNKSRLVVDEYAAEVVRSIYRRKLEGMSAKAIAEQLNSEGVLAPSEYKRLCGLNYHSGFKAGTHAKWQAIQVLRILKNEVYTGTMVQGKRQKINYKIKKIRDVEESGWIKVPNMHEAIIPQKLFDTVQEVLKLDTCASKGQQTVNLFSGMVRCGGCGQNKAYGKETTYTIAPVILWDSTRVWKILTAYVYTGAMVLGKSRRLISGKPISRIVPKGQQYITEGTHEAIVSREEFEKAQLVIRNNSHRVVMGSVDFPLKGKVRCGNCRRAMGYDYKQASPIFWCREGMELIGQTQCSSEIYQASDIENAVFQALKKELSLLDSLYGDIKKEEQSLKEASRKVSRRKTLMEQELKNLKGEKMRMYEEYAAGTLSLDNYKNKKQECDRKIAEVQDKIEQFKAEESVQSVVPGTVRAAAEQAENFLHGTRLTASMVSAFIENVYVHEGGRIVVRFKYEQSIQDAVRALHTD